MTERHHQITVSTVVQTDRKYSVQRTRPSRYRMIIPSDADARYRYP
jgi:hypothetical protein